MLIKKELVGAVAIALAAFNINAQSLSIEEQRVGKAFKVMPVVSSALSQRVNLFTEQVNKAQNLTVLSQLAIRHGKAIWNDAKKQLKDNNTYDDRPLYWARLQMVRALKQAKAYQKSLPDQQNKLLWQFELYSRGQTDIKFDKNTNKKILITGFDPFLLDRNIKQSNPSGTAAIMLDDLVISTGGESAEIETLILPVRFADFDQGMVEELLTPYFKNNAVDMIVTVSMGRNSFELERFPGLRRSSTAPDNVNVLTGANKNNPLLPMLEGEELKGPEFLEFTLPVDAIKAAGGFFPIEDNRIVSTKNETVKVRVLSQLVGEISVEGSGGGYLSNEVSYRSLRLRDLYSPVLPVGHIHTPSLKGHDTKKLKLMVDQIKGMLTQAVKTL